jgi:hypothetical protein
MANPRTDKDQKVRRLLPNPDAPVFSSSWDPKYNLNCYEYAVSGNRLEKVGGRERIEEPDKVNPGTANNLKSWINNSEHNSDEIKKRVLSDGLLSDKDAPKNKNGIPVKKGYYAVAMLIHEGDDFHFMRQNSDGSWSHSPGTNQTVELVCDDKGKPYDIPPHEIKFGDYKFSNYFLVPTAGIDVGCDVEMQKQANAGRKPDEIAKEIKDLLQHLNEPFKPYTYEDMQARFQKEFALKDPPKLGEMFKLAKDNLPPDSPETNFTLITKLLGVYPQLTQKKIHETQSEINKSTALLEYYLAANSVEDPKLSEELSGKMVELSVSETGVKPNELPKYQEQKQAELDSLRSPK